MITTLRCLPFLLSLLALPVFNASASDRIAGEYRLAMAGDIMLGSNYPSNALPPNNGVDLLEEAAPFLKWADVAIGNLEGTLTNEQNSRKVGCQTCYSFRSPPSYAKLLKDAGFDVLNLANNHARDFSDAGFNETVASLNAYQLASTGWMGSSAAIVQSGNRRVCTLGFAPNQGMNDIRNIDRAKQLVSQSRTQCHLVVVTFHGGAEGADKTSTPVGVETFLGENRGDVRAFSRAVIDAGAHIVFGHGPHVPRGIEMYKNHLIAYSLGNFMTYGGMSVSGVSGQAPLLLVRLDANGQLINGRIVSFKQTRMQKLRIDENHGAGKTIHAMTIKDFVPNNLMFTQDFGFYPAK